MRQGKLGLIPPFWSAGAHDWELQERVAPADRHEALARGERSGGIMDAWANHWYIATHQEDLTLEELKARVAGDGESVK